MDEERIVSPELENSTEERIHWTNKSKRKYENIYRSC